VDQRDAFQHIHQYIRQKSYNGELNHAKIFFLKQAIDPQQGLNAH
jgi:hypothetical protein